MHPAALAQRVLSKHRSTHPQRPSIKSLVPFLHFKLPAAPRCQCSIANSDSPHVAHGHCCSDTSDMTTDDDLMMGAMAWLRAPFASGVESELAGGKQFGFKSSYHQAGGLVDVKSEGKDFWKDADFQDVAVLHSGSADPSCAVFGPISEYHSALLEWDGRLAAPLRRYMALLGMPVTISGGIKIETFPRWEGAGQVEARPHIG